MHNFNHERLGIVMQANRLARVCIEEALKVYILDFFPGVVFNSTKTI
jgi:hypothetical protein